MGPKAKWALYSLVAGLLVGALAYLAWPVAQLRLEPNNAPGRVVVAQVLHSGETVGLGFVHSFYRVPQEERYVFAAGHLRLTTVFFGSHDALDYYDPFSIYPRKKVPGGGYEVAIRPPAEFPINFAMGHQTNMWLRLGCERKISLTELMPHGNGFHILVVYRPRLIAEMTERLNGF